MFDISFTELMVIGVVALIVIGPERLPKVARTMGHLLGRAQRYVNEVKTDIQREINLDEVKDLKKQMEDAAQSVRTSFDDTTKSVRQPLDEARDMLNEASRSAQDALNATKTALKETPKLDAAPSPHETESRIAPGITEPASPSPSEATADSKTNQVASSASNEK